MNLMLALCDDDNSIHSTIESFVKKFQLHHDINLELVHYFDGEDLFSAYADGRRFDALLMDIEFPSSNGIDIIHRIHREYCRHITTIILTSYPQYMRSSFSIHPFDFLDKPLDYETFEKRLLSVIEYTLSDEHKIALTNDDGDTFFVSVRDIIYITSGQKLSFKNQIVFFTKEGRYRLRALLSDVPQIINAQYFYSSQRGVYINLYSVHHLDAERLSIVLTDGTSVPISKRKINDFKITYNRFLLSGCPQADK